jgi:hypothetical protein
MCAPEEERGAQVVEAGCADSDAGAEGAAEECAHFPRPRHTLYLTPTPTATDEFAALRVDELTAPHPAMAKYFAAQTALETQLRLDEERLHSTAAGTSTDSSSLQAGASSGSAGAAQRGGKAVAAACLSLALPLPRDL